VNPINIASGAGISFDKYIVRPTNPTITPTNIVSNNDNTNPANKDSNTLENTTTPYDWINNIIKLFLVSV
jgi:hypothetical protein